jgi:uncharacterized membrane protein
MTEPAHGWSNERIEQIVGNLLRVGVITAGLVVLLGGLLFLVQEGRTPTTDGAKHDYRHFSKEVPKELSSLSEIVQGALAGDGEDVIQFGLLLLIATPVARVVFTVFAFLLQRDYLYVGITLIVLAVLLYSLFWGE